MDKILEGMGEVDVSSDPKGEHGSKGETESLEILHQDDLVFSKDINAVKRETAEVDKNSNKNITNEDDGGANKDLEENMKEEDDNPILKQFMKSCQEGDLTNVKELIESRKVKASDTFKDDITGLHWAAINNRLSIVKYLIENSFSKADPNAMGGELNATPLHWASRNGLVYIVDYLMRTAHADPSLRDSQSYNCLHLAVHSSNISLVVYMILSCCNSYGEGKEIFIDEVDNSNRTSLHWAAYQGDFLTVNALLHFGANQNLVDNSGFIPLHWAFIRGNRTVLKSLLEAGSNIFTKNNDQKDSFAISKDMNCYQTWVKILKENRRTEASNWEVVPPLLAERPAKIITFLAPFLILPIFSLICSFSSGLAIPKLFFAVVFLIGSSYIVKEYIIPLYLIESKGIPKSPFMAGVFAATVFWCSLIWIFSILPKLYHFVLTNLLLLGSIIALAWAFFKTMFLNPGFVLPPSDIEQNLHQVYELLDKGKFDSQNFCYSTFARKPLRSKYSRFSKKLIARFDHFCPWVYNEIGVRNHKIFMFFLGSLVLAVSTFVYISLEYFKLLEESSGYDSDNENDKCTFLNDEYCIGYRFQSFHFNILMFTLFQTVWIVYLTCVQLFQICKGLTTHELSHLNDHHSFDQSNNLTTLPLEMRTESHKTGNSGSHGSHSHDGIRVCMKLIGFDQLLLTIKLSVLSLISHSPNSSSSDPLDPLENPTDYGIRTNLLDFWFLGEPSFRTLFLLPIKGENMLNGKMVDYYKLYDYPTKNLDSAV